MLKFAPYDAVPSWARFLTLDEFRALLEAIEGELRGRHLPFEDHDGVLRVAMPDGQIAQCGLANLAVKCGSVGREAYAREVAAHFERLFGPPEALPPFPEAFDEVRSVVKVRIYNDEYLRDNDVPVVSRRLAEGLHAVAVYDLSSVVATVSPTHLQGWGVTPAEAFRVAVENTSKAPVERDTFELGAASVFCLSDGEGFAASQVLRLETLLPPSKLGAIVAVPNRHLLLCYPIQRQTVTEALRELVPFVDGLYREPPGGDERHQLSSGLYWWQKGRLTSLGAGLDRGGLPGAVIAPPQEFIDTVLAAALRGRRR